MNAGLRLVSRTLADLLFISPFCFVVTRVGSGAGAHVANELGKLGNVASPRGAAPAVIDVPCVRVLRMPTLGSLRFVIDDPSAAKATVKVQFVSARLFYLLLAVPIAVLAMMAIVRGLQVRGAVVTLVLVIFGAYYIGAIIWWRRAAEIRRFIEATTSGT